jgi:hypothetical protein
MSVEIEPGRPLVFNHVPKTAGTSLSIALLDALTPKFPFNAIGAAALGTFTDVDQLSPQTRAMLVMSPSDIPAQADAVFGHVAPSVTRQRFPELFQLTILREPRSRLVSHWLYSRAHTNAMLRHLGGWGEYVKQARAPLPEFLDNSRVAFYTDNLVTRAMVWPHDLAPADAFIDSRHDDELVEGALAVLDGFDFVGAIEDPNLPASISSWLGRDLKLPRVNESPSMKRSLRCDVPVECDAANELLEQRSRLDSRLWIKLAARTYLAGLGADELETERQRIFDRALTRYQSVRSTGRSMQLGQSAVHAAKRVRARLGGR